MVTTPRCFNRSRTQKLVAGHVLLIVLLLIPAAIGAQNTDGSVRIAWEPVQGAASYRLQIRREGAVFIDTEVTAAEFSMDLAQGSYSYRVLVQDPFGNSAAATDWMPLKVERPRTPFFRLESPQTLPPGTAGARLVLSKSDFADGTLLSLTNGRLTVPVSLALENGKRTIAVPETLAVGSWSLQAAAPSGRSYSRSDAVIIEEVPLPAPQELLTDAVTVSELVSLRIRGTGFNSQTRVFIRSNARDIQAEAVVTDEDGLTALINLSGMEPGTYTVIVQNPGKEEVPLPVPITVEPEQIIVREPIDPETQISSVEIHTGYSPFLMIRPDNNFVIPVYLGVEAAVLIHSGWDIPFISGLGMEARLIAGMSGPAADQNGGTLQALGAIDLSLYWRPALAVAPSIQLGVGSMRSGYAETYGLQNLLYFKLGTALNITGRLGITHIGVETRAGFNENSIIWMVGFSVRQGFRM